MRCAVCGKDLDAIEHRWFEGLCPESRKPGQKPIAEWTVVAPLHYVASPDFRTAMLSLCSSACAVAYRGL